jgi:diguanylate cyclase (GGDEF)-like protein
LLVIFDYYERLVKHQQFKLGEANALLEKQVQQRTLELQAANDALQQEKEFLHKLSYQDQLTGVYNRHKIEEMFDYQKAQWDRYHEAFSFLLLDVDRFKQINDMRGHEVGDEVLKQIAAILRQHTRTSDLVARWGGDEFVVLATKTDSVQMQALAEVVRSQVANLKLSALDNVSVTASIGIATVRDEDSLKTLVRRADDALYEAKGAGRNQIKAL